VGILDTAIQFAGFVAEALVIGLVLYRRLYKLLPLFSFYLIWSLASDLGEYVFARRFPAQGPNIYLGCAIVDAIFMFFVVIEVSMSVLKPIRAWLPRWAIFAVTFVIALCGLAVWHFMRFPGFERLNPPFPIIEHLQTTLSAVRILFFLVLACFSQLLSIGWRDRELQIATGFGFYSIASLSVTMLHMNQGVGTPQLNHQYYQLDALAAGCYVCSLFYWVICFAQEVPERREFTPQMQNFLLAVAGNARATRMAMTSSSKSNSDPKSHR
jgi:hypothetical protein